MTDTVDEFLEHHGVKGMKWGVRRAHAKEMRSLNKASRKKDREENNSKIDAARERIRSGQAKSDYKAAKAQYKADKHVIGSREAKKALNKVKEKNYEDYQKSSELKSGKEKAGYALAAAGLITVSVLMNSKR